MKYKVVAYLDYVSGYLRYGHLEGIVEAESEEALKEMMKQYDFIDKLDVKIDDYEVADYGDVGEFEYEVLDS